MKQFTPSETLIFAYIFSVTLGITLVMYILRGLAIPGFTAIPGGILWMLILLSITTGIIYGVQKTRRY